MGELIKHDCLSRFIWGNGIRVLDNCRTILRVLRLRLLQVIPGNSSLGSMYTT